MTLRSTLIALVVMLLLTPSAQSAQKSSSKKKKSEATEVTRVQTVSEDSAVKNVLASLSAAATAQDADKMAAVFTEDAFYVDSEGAETKGRAALKDRFASALTGRPKSTIVLNASHTRFPSADSAWVEGTATRQTGGVSEPSTRFSMLLQKQAGTWLIASAIETPIASKTVTDQLSNIAWLIGDWSAQQKDGKLHMNASWAGNKSFILMKFAVSRPGEAEKHDTQIIGWDPSKEQVVSWHFDDDGGFGYGSWTKRGKQWVINLEGVEQSGSRTTAINIVSPQDQNSFSWQSVNRAIDGMGVPDTETITVQRTPALSSRDNNNI